MKRKVLFLVLLIVASCFIGCKNPVDKVDSKETVSESEVETLDYLDSYVGHWSDINTGLKHSIDVVISKDAIEGTVFWEDGFHADIHTTSFTSSTLKADGENGLVADISYVDERNKSFTCKLTGHFRDLEKNTLVLQFHNTDTTFRPKLFTLYKHYY